MASPLLSSNIGAPTSSQAVSIHQLPFIENQEIGIIATQHIGIPSRLGPDALVRPGALNQVLRFVFGKDTSINETGEIGFRLPPELGNLLVRWCSIKDSPAFQEGRNCDERHARGLTRAAAGTDDFTFCVRAQDGLLLRVRLCQADLIFSGVHILVSVVISGRWLPEDRAPSSRNKVSVLR